MVMHQACYYEDEAQDESLCLPFQSEQHGVTFDLTPRDWVNAQGHQGKQCIMIEEKEIPLMFDGRKLFLNI